MSKSSYNMKLLKYSLVFLVLLIACGNYVVQGGKNNGAKPVIESQTRDFRTAMRNFVVQISSYGKERKTGFIVIPQNGIELVTHNGEPTGIPSSEYLEAIDANGQESLFFGYVKDNKATPKDATNYTRELLDISAEGGNSILVTDYCSSMKKMNNSIKKNKQLGYISFAANERNLNNIPEYPESVYNENKEDITIVNSAKNFLYLINYENFTTKEHFLDAVGKTNYDALIIDLFFNDGSILEMKDIARLKVKANGSKRLVICYMSIGEAEDYRFYWKKEWGFETPQWLDDENDDWPGNYKVKYWEEGWKNIILGGEDAYLDKIINADFDGVYLDIIDAFEFYENR